MTGTLRIRFLNAGMPRTGDEIKQNAYNIWRQTEGHAYFKPSSPPERVELLEAGMEGAANSNWLLRTLPRLVNPPWSVTGISGRPTRKADVTIPVPHAGHKFCARNLGRYDGSIVPGLLRAARVIFM